MDGDFLEAVKRHAVKRHVLSHLQLRATPASSMLSPGCLFMALHGVHTGGSMGKVGTSGLTSSQVCLCFFISGEGNWNLFLVQASLWLCLRR